jgi:hypothetical protein
VCEHDTLTLAPMVFLVCSTCSAIRSKKVLPSLTCEDREQAVCTSAVHQPELHGWLRGAIQMIMRCHALPPQLQTSRSDLAFSRPIDVPRPPFSLSTAVCESSFCAARHMSTPSCQSTSSID